jgi:hypothetical protein
VQSVASRSGNDTVLWLANLTGEAQTVEIEGLPEAEGRIARLDEGNFAGATSGPDGFLDAALPGRLDRIELAPYAVARLAVRG